MPEHATPVDETEAGRQWLANYYGSIDATALLLAFKAGHEAGMKRLLGDDSTLTVNVLRSWEAARIERFALHLLGDDMQALVAKAEERGAARERALCLADIEGERLTGETGEEADAAYNMALEHVAMVIRARTTQS